MEPWSSKTYAQRRSSHNTFYWENDGLNSLPVFSFDIWYAQLCVFERKKQVYTERLKVNWAMNLEQILKNLMDGWRKKRGQMRWMGYPAPCHGSLSRDGEADSVKQHAMKINIKQISKINVKQHAMKTYEIQKDVTYAIYFDMIM